jgi:hypothetical protein
MFVAIMTTLLSPLAMFQGDDPFRNLKRVRSEANKVEAIELITTETRKTYGRLKVIILQRIDELADELLGTKGEKE